MKRGVLLIDGVRGGEVNLPVNHIGPGAAVCSFVNFVKDVLVM